MTDLKKAQERSVLEKNIPDLAVQLFLGTYNCEVNRVDILTMIFDSFQMSSSTDMTLRILGQMSSNIDGENIMFDLCMILQTIVIKTYSVLCDDVCNFGKKKIINQGVVAKKIWKCRPSLTKILEQQNKMRIQSNDGQDQHIPPDMPLNLVVWSSKSSTEQQIILLIICLQQKYIESRHAFLTTLFGNVTRKEIDMYTVKPHRMQSIVDVTMSILQKINNNVDTSRIELTTLINSFTESCFKGVFGESHRSIMTFPFFVQMYIIAYLERPIQAKFYQESVTTFNRRLEFINKELTIATYIPQNLIENMEYWCNNNQFSTFNIQPIFRIMCV